MLLKGFMKEVSNLVIFFFFLAVFFLLAALAQERCT